MATLRQRLQWSDGTISDGPRRYLMMRPDVLMGAVAALDEAARSALLAAWAGSTCEFGSASLQAYANDGGGDAQALIAATTAAAADLGWGRWAMRHEAWGLSLTVAHSPFVDGWRAAGQAVATQPVCAPVRGLFTALASAARRGAWRVDEVHCAAMHPHAGQPCRFEARGPA